MNILKSIIKSSIYKSLQSNKPDFLIIGAQKAGTTSLHYYLHQHPSLQGALEKEVSFFSNEQNYFLGLDWYHSKFKDIRNPFPSKKTLFFESTPEYIYNHKSIERIHQYNKELKLILILREPVSRAFSAWNMFRDFKTRTNGIPEVLLDNRESSLYKELYSTKSFPSFNQVVEKEFVRIKEHSTQMEPSFIRRGIYVEQLKNLFNYFDASQVLILDFNELQKNTLKTLEKVTRFLNINNDCWSEKASTKSYNKRPYVSKIDPNVKEKLKEFYIPYNEELFDLINKKFDW